MEDKCALPEGFLDIMTQKDDNMEGTKSIPKVSTEIKGNLHKGKNIFCMIRATLVMVKALGKILCEMEVEAGKEE